MILLTLLSGAIVGLSLGLTGGGGAIFAVPLLVYAIGLPPREAVGVSLAAVGATAFAGFLGRWRMRQVDIRTGAIFAAGGMAGAPLGTWGARLIPEALLLLLFAALMLVVAARMWRQAAAPPELHASESPDQRACHRDSTGTLRLTSRCALMLVAAGIAAGLLAGLFGVGGGFVIVPALVLVARMPIHVAVGTSLMVIALVSVSGVASHVWAGSGISLPITGVFVLGGIGGMLAGQTIATRLSGPTLQKTFAAAILAVAAFVLYRNLTG